MKSEYHGGAFAWADQNYDQGWTKSINRFESAMVLSLKTGDFHLFQLELNYYKNRVLDYFNEYKQYNKKAARDSFLNKIRLDMGGVNEIQIDGKNQ